MSSATENNVTVTFDPTAINKQSDVIGPASAGKAGVMTGAQATQLTALSALDPATIAALSELDPATVAALLELSTLAAAGAGALIYNNTTRPLANDPMFLPALAAGRVAEIWNSDDLAPNYSDGVNWYDASGNLT